MTYTELTESLTTDSYAIQTAKGIDTLLKHQSYKAAEGQVSVLSYRLDRVVSDKEKLLNAKIQFMFQSLI